MNTHLLLQLVVNGLIVGALYGVVAMSFVLIYKASQVVNFAQGDFFMLGMYFVLFAVSSVGLGVALGSLAILIAVWIAGWVFTLAQWLPPAGILLHAVGAPVSFSQPIAYLE